MKYLLLFVALVMYACGDLSDTCQQSGNHTICYYTNELDEAAVKQVGDFLQQQYSSATLKVKLNNHDDMVIVQVEVNTSLAAERQQEFLTAMAQALSDNCFKGKKVRAVGVDDVDATTKGNATGESK